MLADDCEAMHAWRWAELKLKLERLANVLDAADHAGGFKLQFTNPKEREVHRITSAAQVKRLFESVVPHGEKKALRARLQPLLDGREIGAGRDLIVLVLTSGRPEDVISDAFHKLVAGKHANVYLTLVVYSDEALPKATRRRSSSSTSSASPEGSASIRLLSTPSPPCNLTVY